MDLERYVLCLTLHRVSVFWVVLARYNRAVAASAPQFSRILGSWRLVHSTRKRDSRRVDGRELIKYRTVRRKKGNGTVPVLDAGAK